MSKQNDMKRRGFAAAALLIGVVGVSLLVSTTLLGSATANAAGSVLCMPTSGTYGWLYGDKRLSGWPASEGGESPYHNGVDIWGTKGVTRVYAAADGYVTILNTSYGGYSIRLEHRGAGLWTFYDHMGRANIKVRNGQFVRKGQFLGYMGDDQGGGVAHLHFAVNNKPYETAGSPGNLDPSRYLGIDVSYPRGPAWGAPVRMDCPSPTPTPTSTSTGRFNWLIAPGDFNGDGHADVIGRKPNGTLWLYKGNGSGGWINGHGIKIGTGW